jgi:hypothetical protein
MLSRLVAVNIVIVGLLFGSRTGFADTVLREGDVGKVFDAAGPAIDPSRKIFSSSSSTSSYAQGSYYSQSSYTYNTVFTKNATEQVNFTIVGGLDKGSGTFVIDHPLDPKNKLLFHSFVESPDAKNIYDGIATLDAKGDATVTLPGYFMALNMNFRYQLKSLGIPQPNLFIKSEVNNNHFTIGGGKPFARVSWQVSGVRQDPFIVANPIIAEVEKGTSFGVRRGEFLHPDVYTATFPITERIVTYLRDFFGRPDVR